MPLPTKTITVHDTDDNEVVITVQEASLLAGLKRGRLMGELIYGDAVQGLDPDLANAYSLYCDLAAGTASVEGMDWPLEPEQFVELSDLWFDCVGLPWLRAVRELNPHWAPDYQETDDSGEAVSAVE